MTAKQFIESKGVVTDDNTRFVNAGSTVVIPLVDLLEEYAGLNVKPVPAPVKKPKRK